MYAQQVHYYLQTFFNETHCQILQDNNHSMTVQLTNDIDKKIMNRPFYWQYVEVTNTTPNPSQLTLITNRQKLVGTSKGEIIDFGTPRLHQLFQATKELGAFVEMYEKVNKLQTTNLTPWLGVNYKVSYCSHQTKEMVYSLGINLMTGYMVDGFQESVAELNLLSEMPDNVFILPFIIKPLRGLERLDQAIENTIHQDDHMWAEEAKSRWQYDQDVLDYFYEGVEVKPDCYEMEKTALEEQYAPKIKIDIINGGLFYLN